jgi:hypothetical protein
MDGFAVGQFGDARLEKGGAVCRAPGQGRPICTEMLPGNTADTTVLLPVIHDYDGAQDRGEGATRKCGINPMH